MKIKEYVTFIFILLINVIGYSQNTVTGKIIDVETQEPIDGASIYFDGTTIGTVSTNNGNFKLTYKQSTKALLVVSSMGYEAQQFQITAKETNLKVISLQPSIESLDEVMLETDPWSRKKKLNYFREWFLGVDYKNKRCKILNEDDIQLRFSPSKKEMTANTPQTLIIENKYLGYKIHYQLQDFVLRFNETSDYDGNKYYSPYSFYYIGTSFFKELKRKTKKKFKKRRAETYLGSITHFMRALANKQLKENDYKIFYESMQTQPYRYFTVKPLNKLTEITIQTSKLSILYNNILQSFIQVNDDKLSTTFYIDKLGNFYPNYNFSFGGDMGSQRASNLLPLDYGL